MQTIFMMIAICLAGVAAIHVQAFTQSEDAAVAVLGGCLALLCGMMGVVIAIEKAIRTLKQSSEDKPGG
jgi:hypothetical protein